MALYSPYASGLGNSAAYQVAGKPYLTGSTMSFQNNVNLSGDTTGGATGPSNEYKVTFPTVTRSVTITNFSTGSNIVVYFSPKATSPSTIIGSHYRIVDSGGTSITMNIKCSELYISPLPTGKVDYFSFGQVGGDPTQGHFEGFNVFAELTGVPSAEMYELTGSGINVSTYTDGQN